MSTMHHHPTPSSESRWSRRRFLGATASAVGVALGSEVLPPGPAHAAQASCGAVPRPIPGGTVLIPGGELFHFFGFAPGLEQSTITDFNGFVGSARIFGTGTGTPGEAFPFRADMRFMKGKFVGVDGRLHRGTFGFI